MSGALADREMRDLNDAVLTYAEIKALAVGDPLLKTRIETANELERVKIRCRQREQELCRLDHIVRECPARTAGMEQQIERILRDREHFEKNRETMTRDEREAFGEELLEASIVQCRQRQGALLRHCAWIPYPPSGRYEAGETLRRGQRDFREPLSD